MESLRFTVEACEDDRAVGLDAGRHETILRGELHAGAPRPGAPLRIPAREGAPLVARVLRFEPPDRLVVAEPAVLRAFVGSGTAEGCDEETYGRDLVAMLDDDRVRNLFHDRLYPPTAAVSEAFAPPACDCIEVLRGRRGVIEPLRAMLRSWEPENVAGAAQALALFGPEVAIEPLLRLLRHNVARVRYRAARLLEPHADDARVRGALAGLARDPDPRLRRLVS